MVVKLMAEVKAYIFEHRLESCDCLEEGNLIIK